MSNTETKEQIEELLIEAEEAKRNMNFEFAFLLLDRADRLNFNLVSLTSHL